MEAPGAPVALSPARLSEALAVVIATLVQTLSTGDQLASLETIATRLDGYSRLPSGSSAAAMVGSVARDLMRMEQ